MGVAITADLCDIYNRKCTVLYIKVKLIEQSIKDIPFKFISCIISFFADSGLDRGNAH